ncbi:BglG family transcription antiterminator [Enterococcus gallinarum]|uniref:BglG family transcription antiterminator n=1 Tax=Enterococcus gallinarum TaxID=1353 RepID=UPI001D179D75|nr:PTS sugar transporter subunit IIA [Enterococcus gallinarum]MCC4044845.1 PTS sugar transporter subunit IIA [Enterococcus gallinarum]
MELSRREKMLLQLLLAQKDFKPAAFFQEKLYVSLKTVYTDLASLEEKISSDGLTISRLPRKGVKLEGGQQAREKASKRIVTHEKKMDEYAPDYRKLFIFANYFFSKKPMHYQAFADYFYVSYQSIKKDVDEIFAFCRKKNVAVGMTANGLKFNEAESVQQSTFKAFLEKYTDSARLDHSAIQSLFEPRIVELTTALISEISLTLGRQLNSYFVESLTVSLEIFLSRICLGSHLEQQEELVFEKIKQMKLYMVGISFSERIERELAVLLTDTDIHYLCSLLLAHGIEPYMQITEKRAANVIAATEDMIEKMSRLLDTDLTQDHLLLQALLSHIVPMIHRLQNGMLVKNPLLKLIKKQYSTMFTLTKYAIGDLEKNFALFLTEDEVSFLTIHFQLAFEKVKVTKHVLIVCSSGLATSELIFNRIKRTISAATVLEIISGDKLASTSLEMVDLIISTVPIEEVTPPVLYVSPLPTTEEIAMISANLSNIDENEKKFHSAKYQSSKLLQKYLDPAFLYIKQPFGSKGEVLDFLAESYLNHHLVTTDFKQSLYAREELGSTGLKTGVAIPHADPQTVKTTKLTFVTLPKAIKWGDTEVQLVVLLAIAEKNMSEAKELIASIYDLFNSPEEIRWVVSSKNREELYRKLVRGGTQDVF